MNNKCVILFISCFLYIDLQRLLNFLHSFTQWCGLNGYIPYNSYFILILLPHWCFLAMHSNDSNDTVINLDCTSCCHSPLHHLPPLPPFSFHLCFLKVVIHRRLIFVGRWRNTTMVFTMQRTLASSSMLQTSLNSKLRQLVVVIRGYFTVTLTLALRFALELSMQIYKTCFGPPSSMALHRMLAIHATDFFSSSASIASNSTSASPPRESTTMIDRPTASVHPLHAMVTPEDCQPTFLVSQTTPIPRDWE